MKRINLKNGFAVVPDDCIVVDQTKTESSDYAGIVVEKNGTIPHYLVFFDHPVSECTDDDVDSVFAFLGRQYPEVEKVRKREIKAKFRNGRLVNAEEWKAAPCLGLFTIREVSSMNDLYFGTGIIREEGNQ